MLKSLILPVALMSSIAPSIAMPCNPNRAERRGCGIMTAFAVATANWHAAVLRWDRQSLLQVR